jgi:hypothetical protein
VVIHRAGMRPIEVDPLDPSLCAIW